MNGNGQRPFAIRLRRWFIVGVAVACVLAPRVSLGQAVTGTLFGTVKDEQAGALATARVRLSSPALIGGPVTRTTNDKGQFRFPALPPGSYRLDIEIQQFTTYHEEDIHIGAGASIERTAVLTLAGVAESVVVEGTRSRIEARNPGFGTRFGPEDLQGIPTRRTSMFDAIKAAPGVSPTSPSSGTISTVSAFGSGTNENTFLVDGTNFTCPCSGVPRAEPGIDFIQEVHIQSIGASAEFGNAQGAVVNVVTKQGSERFLYDASFYGQTDRLTSHPVRLPISGSNGRDSGYGRARYRDLTTNLGGPAVRQRLWFFGGYEYLRDHASQPGTDPAFPRTYEQDKVFAKLTWKLAAGWQLVQSFHEEFGISPEQPTLSKPFETTSRNKTTVPALTFGHLTHTVSDNTLWDARVGRVVYTRDGRPSSGDPTTPSRFDTGTGITSGAPPVLGWLINARTTAKTTISHYRPSLFGADHEWKAGGEVERGEHQFASAIPTGVRYVDTNGNPSQAVSFPPSNIGGLFITGSAFASDAIAMGDRLTVNAGVRFDHSRAISQDFRAIDTDGRQTGGTIRGLGTLYTWNLWSPRLGVTLKASADGRTMVRASYGRFSQGVLTGEFPSFHPGATSITTRAFVPADGDYTRIQSVVDPRVNLQLNPDVRAPHSDEYSIGVDRALARRLSVAMTYVRKDGSNYIGWTDTGGEYRQETRSLADGRTIPVFALVNSTAARRFLLTNPEGYALTYNGLVWSVEKRRSSGWQASGSYTLSRASGLLASSGASADGEQVSSIGGGVTFGRDPNDLTNARGRLPNDRPHIVRVRGGFDVPRTGFVIAASLGHFSGKPWAATTQVALPQNTQQRVQLEARGSRRLSSQTLLDMRVSRPITFGRAGRVELLIDLLNVLNDRAEEGLATDNLSSSNFGRQTVFVDPRRVMFAVRMNLGR